MGRAVEGRSWVGLPRGSGGSSRLGPAFPIFNIAAGGAGLSHSFGRIRVLGTPRIVAAGLIGSSSWGDHSGWPGSAVLRNPAGSGRAEVPTSIVNPTSRGCGVPQTPATRGQTTPLEVP